LNGRDLQAVPFRKNRAIIFILQLLILLAALAAR